MLLRADWGLIGVRNSNYPAKTAVISGVWKQSPECFLRPYLPTRSILMPRVLQLCSRGGRVAPKILTFAGQSRGTPGEDAVPLLEGQPEEGLLPGSGGALHHGDLIRVAP